MKKKKPVLSLLAILLAGAYIHAETVELTADKAVELSLKNNLALKADNLQVKAKQRSKDMSWNAFIPKMSATAAFSRLNDGFTNPFSALIGKNFLGGAYDSLFVNPENFWIASGSFSAQLNISLALFDGIKHTVLDYQSSAIQAETARQRIIRDTKKSFFNLLLLKENIATFEGLLETTKKRYEKEKKNFDAGVGSEFSMLSAQVGLESMKPGLDEMKIGYAVAELAFKQQLGLGDSATLDIKGSFDLKAAPLDGEKLKTAAMTENWTLASIRKGLEIQKNFRRAKFDLTYIPILGMNFTADPTFQRDPFKNSLFAGSAGDWKQSNGMFSLYVSMPLDGLLPFSSASVDLANMDDGIAQSELALLTAMQGIEVQTMSLVMQVEKSRKTVERLELNVGLASRAYQMAEKGYSTGAYELLQVEDAENKLRQSKLAVMAEKYSFMSGLFDLEFETNQTLTVK